MNDVNKWLKQIELLNSSTRAHTIMYLNDSLGLTKHCGRVELGPVFGGHIVRHFQEHFNLVVDGNPLPVRLGLEGGVDGKVDQLWGCPVKLSNLVLVVMGLKKIIIHYLCHQLINCTIDSY